MNNIYRPYSDVEGSYMITVHTVQLLKEIISKSDWKTAEYVFV